ncbi:MAG TPA: GntR family transcriptional regulator [Acidimicrobiia bacterium]|nr:GntR family transcriptional regulator [Acidimicrobiia bacterium]
MNSPAADDAVRSSTRVEHVYEKLRANIVLGHYEPGSPLRLSDLVDEYGVSLIPIREALRRLEVERLVENSPNRGARVATASIAEVEDAYETRWILESEALRRAWPHLDDGDIEESHELLLTMFDAFAEGDVRRGTEVHRRLHFGLWQRGNSTWLDHLIRILWSHTERYRNLALILHAPAPSDDEYHALLLAAARRGDLVAALRHTRDELEESRSLVIDHLMSLDQRDETEQTA